MPKGLHVEQGLNLGDLRARVRVPADLTVDVRGGMCTLTSGGRSVEVLLIGRHVGVFAKGPVRWDDVCLRWLYPALLALQTAHDEAAGT